jgi:hypothetical protein
MYGSPGPGPQQPHTWSSDPTPNAPGYGGGGYGGYGGGPMVQQPAESPGTVLKVFGILGLSFAGINLIYNGFGIIQSILQQRQFARMGSEGGAQSVAMSGMQEMLDATIKLTIGSNVAMILMDIALVVVGILLLQRKDIGRKLAIAWAGLGLIVLIGRAVSFEIILMPHLERFMGEISKGASADSPLGNGLFSAFARVGTYLSLGFMAIWPVTLLVAMNMQSVKNAVKQNA